MQIGINCLDVNPSFVGGVTTYTAGLLDGFAKVGNGCRFRLFVTERNQGLFNSFRTRSHFEVVVVGGTLLPLRSKICRGALLSCSGRIFKSVNDFVFKRIRELMDAETDLLYTPSPVLRCFDNQRPTVLTMHDIQHLHHPEFFSWPRRLSRTITYGLSARYATYLQANTEYTKKDFLTHFPELSPEQVEVIPVGVNIERFATPSRSEEVRKRYDLPERFLLYPAQLWPHKNHLTVLKALKHIAGRNRVKIPLLLTGGEYAAASKVFRFIADNSMTYVRHLGKVPGQDMISLYQEAAFVVAAGLYESSSAPMLEAAAAGTPVIASRIPPFEELGRVLQLNLFEPLDVDDLAKLIVDLWNDQEIGRSQAIINRRQIACFSFENTARKYMDLFERVVNS
jgi:glycosyltransferase involved in cell wall biosynthesis